MNKKTITYLIWNTNNNGGNKVVFEHANRLNKRGHHVKIFTIFGSKPEWFNLNIKIEKLFLLNLFTFSDILIATFWPTVWIANFLKSKRKIYFVQGWEEDLYDNIIIKKLAKVTHKFPFEKIAISKFVVNKIQSSYKNNLPIHIIKDCGIDKNIFKRKPRKILNKEIKILSVISWYQWYKGADLLAKTVKEIKKKHPEYIFTLVSCEKKPYAPVFDNFVSNPKQIKLAQIYRESDILLITSRSEGFFMPGLEAMACGCAVITTNCGGINEYAINSYNAIILKNLAQLWEENIIEKLIVDKKLINKLVNNGLETVNKYSWEKILNDLEKIYSMDKILIN